MKKDSAGAAFLTPDANGWRVRLADGVSQNARSLEEAAQVIPADQRIHLALPGNLVVLERLTFPSTDRDELAGMLQLQLEKTLPYPLEEVSSDFEVIRQSETESTLLSVATNTHRLDELCQPFRNRARLPQKITLYAMHVAAAAPADQVVACFWPEEGQLQFAICENGKLGFAYTFPQADADSLLAELPQVLLSAEMEGVPTTFQSIRVERDCAQLNAPLADFFGQPISELSFPSPLPEAGANLLPEAWQTETRRLARNASLKNRLQLAAVAYLVLVAVAFVYLAWMKSRVQKLEAQIALLQPQLELSEARKARWEALLPAFDPSRFTVEILYHLFTNLPSQEVHFTAFDHSPGQFMIEGEAPSANLAIDYIDKLKAEKGLEAFRIESGQPSILPNGSAHFRIFGKL
ncbi:MAG TPA: pilus assembly protein PilM [Chthoniobacteraceae bacterium]|nr:pilus assembly protein PilM [Chthoniobacteraceae bacterium]